MTSFHVRVPTSFRMEAAHRSARTRRVTPVRLLAFLMMLTATMAGASARSADDYYHAASFQYVAGKIQEASVEAEEGLRLHPGDAKLRMLAEHLRDLKERQRGNQGQGNGQDQEGNRDRSDGNDSQEKGGKGDQGKKPGDRDHEDAKDDKDNKGNGGDGDTQEQPQDSPTPRDQDAERDTGGNNARGTPGAMSQEEAERLLNSFADDEKKEQGERRKVIRSRAGTEQDW